MLKYIDADKWEPIDNFILENAGIDVVKSQKNYCVVAGPGAGKTELLAQRASYLLQTKTCAYPRMILALSYKKDAEKNLRERVTKRVGSELSSRFISLTYDAFAKNILDRFRAALPDEYRPTPDYQIAKDINQAYEAIYNVKLAWLQRLDLFEYFVRNILLLPILDSNSKVRLGKSVKETWQGLINGVPGQARSVLTFPAISILAEYIIRINPRIKKALALSYSHVFLDEFQDTTKAQYSLVSTCFNNPEYVVTTAVGDDKQRIMVWAGAYDEIFEKFQKDFKAAKKILLMNYRSAPRLIAVQRVFMSLMFEEEPKTQWNKDRWQDSDGESEIWLFNNDQQEAKIVAQKVDEVVGREKITPRDICVIVRQRPQVYSENLIKELSKFGINARVENEYQDLLSEELTLLLLNLIELGVSTRAPQAYLDCLDSIKLLRGVSANLDYDNKAQKVEKELTELQVLIKASINEVREKEHLHDLINQVLKEIGLSSIKSMMPQYRSDEYRNHLISTLRDFLWKEYQEIDSWKSAIKKLRGENALPIMTIHKSKGLEYNTIVFVGLEDSAFWNFRNASQEEIRNFFVALSRAKKRAIFTFTRVRNKKLNVVNDIHTLYNALSQSKVVDIVDHRSQS